MQTAVTRNITIAPPVPPLVKGMIRVLLGVSVSEPDAVQRTHVRIVSHVAINTME